MLYRVKQGNANNIFVKRSDGRIFNSALLASKISSCNPSHITSVCKGKRKTAGGWGWQYNQKIRNANDR